MIRYKSHNLSQRGNLSGAEASLSQIHFSSGGSLPKMTLQQQEYDRLIQALPALIPDDMLESVKAYCTELYQAS